MKNRGILFFSLFAACVGSGCAGMNGEETLTLKYNDEENISSVYQKYDLSVMNKEPKVLIAIPKNKTGKLKLKPAQGETRIFGSKQESNATQDITRNDPTVTTGSTKTEAPIEDGILGKLFGSTPDNSQPQVLTDYDPQQDLAMPVVSTIYGGPVTVIKSVNGGFGMILLKQGAEQNALACQALFKALPSMSSEDIEKAAMKSEGLFRPTYWLDSRTEKKVPKAETSLEVASKEPDYMPYLTFTTAASASNGQNKPEAEKKSDAIIQHCEQRLPHYNFALSHTLLGRLALLEKRGPFLVAWEETSSKAMILDMSGFDQRRDFEEAVETWTKMIVRHPKVWEAGVIQQAGVKQKLRHILNKGGKSILSLLNPSGTEAKASN